MFDLFVGNRDKQQKSKVNGHLSRLSKSCLVKGVEEERIEASLSVIKERLREHFKGEVASVKVFGSYKRGTHLPLKYDHEGDVDILVVFDGNLVPQTYLDKLKRFVERHYPRSLVAQASPAIVLEMRMIRFELVPATIRTGLLGGKVLQIPAPRKDYATWLDTNPEAFEARLTAANKECKGLVKPLVRIMKCWNANHSKPFPTYELEGSVVEFAEDCHFTTLEQAFEGYAKSLSTWGEEGQWKTAIQALKGTVDSLHIYAGNQTAREEIIRTFLPIK